MVVVDDNEQKSRQTFDEFEELLLVKVRVESSEVVVMVELVDVWLVGV